MSIVRLLVVHSETLTVYYGRKHAQGNVDVAEDNLN